MCGIAGFINLGSDSKVCKNIVKETLKTTRHRGPDQSDVFLDKVFSYNICLGINRLSIIDLGPSGNQPMYLDDLAIVYNGEVYNYLEIKEELIKKGHHFVGHSDTEVVLHAFKEWGISSISKFVGMFALAIFDKTDNKLYLIRDRVGEKPLYYYNNNDTFIFSSELKGILIHDFVSKELDANSVFNYFLFNSVSAPHTIFTKIKQVNPGQILTVCFNSDKICTDIVEYWSLPQLAPDYSLTEEKVLDDLSRLIYDAVKIRLRSDVPLGIFLSGGIDSALIAAIASQISAIKTFTIGYKDKRHDESSYAEFVAKQLKAEHETIHLDETKADMNFSNLAYLSDDCTGNLSFIPYNILAQKTRDSVKVALSGDGGDEFFCGYAKSYKIIVNLFNYRWLLKLVSRGFRFNKAVDVLNDILFGGKDLNVLMAQFVIRNRLKTVKGLFKDGHEDLQVYRRVNAVEKLSQQKRELSFWGLNFYEGGGNYLSDIALKTSDRASMFHGLEVRSVLTDHRIIEYMAHVPEGIILKRNIDKFLLKKILCRYLPKNYVFKRPKKGFAVPLISDFNRQWHKSIETVKSLWIDRDCDFFNLAQLNHILSSKSNRYNIRLQSRLVFLANFTKIWEIN